MDDVSLIPSPSPRCFPHYFFSRTSQEPAPGEDDPDRERSIGWAHGLIWIHGNALKVATMSSSLICSWRRTPDPACSSEMLPFLLLPELRLSLLVFLFFYSDMGHHILWADTGVGSGVPRILAVDRGRTPLLAERHGGEGALSSRHVTWATGRM